MYRFTVHTDIQFSNKFELDDHVLDKGNNVAVCHAVVFSHNSSMLPNIQLKSNHPFQWHKIKTLASK